MSRNFCKQQSDNLSVLRELLFKNTYSPKKISTRERLYMGFKERKTSSLLYSSLYSSTSQEHHDAPSVLLELCRIFFFSFLSKINYSVSKEVILLLDERGVCGVGFFFSPSPSCFCLSLLW